MLKKLKFLASAIYYRVAETSPKLFKWFKRVGVLMIAYGFFMLTVVPDLDFGIYIFNEGERLEKIFYASQVLILIGLGMVIPSSMVVKNFESYLDKVIKKNDDTEDK